MAAAAFAQTPPAAAPAAAATVAAAPTSIRVTSNDNYPPFFFLDAEGKPHGYSVDMWNLFQKRTGIRVELELTDWDSAVQNIETGKADVIDMFYRTPSRAAGYDFSAPYADLPVDIFVDRGIGGIRSVATLQGLPVGAQRGDACVERLKDAGITNVKLFDNDQNIVKAAVHGGLRVFCMDQYPADYYLYRASAVDRFYRGFTLFIEQSRWAVRKGDTAVFQAVQRGMAMITPAERQQLRERWLDHPVMPMGDSRIVNIVAIALAVVVLLALLLALWAWTLRRTVAARTADMQSQEGKLRTIFDASPAAMWVQDLDGIYREGNDRTAALFREPCDAPVGRRSDELFDAAFAASIGAQDSEAVKLKHSTRTQLSLNLCQGGIRHFEVTSVPLCTPQGEAYGVMNSARDVTDWVLSEAQLRLWAHAFQHAAFGMYLCDARSKTVIAVNQTFASERGYTVEEMAGLPVDALYPLELVAERAALRATSDLTDHYVWETEQVTKYGRCFPVRLDCSVFHDADGSAQYVFIHAQDISERKRAESELRLAAVAFEMQEALIVLDSDRIVRQVNEAFGKLTGYQPDEVVGRHVSMFNSGQNAPEFYENLWADAWRDGFWQGEMWLKANHDQPKVVSIKLSSVTDDDGQVSYFVCSMVDITSEREAHANADRVAFFDPLTGLPNRNFLQGQIQHLLDGDGTCVGALLLFDLDKFKRVNDLHGHTAGDRLLVLVAQRLRNMLDEDCVLSRFSGGTFVLLLPVRAETPAMLAGEVMDYAERMREVLREPFRLDGEALTGMTISLGWVELIAGCDSPETLLKQAELAMYAAKVGGRDRVCRFESEMQVALVRREMLAGDLMHAIADESLEIYYQAQADRRCNVVGAEVLLRWRRPDGTWISPADFIPVAEESGLILPLGDWVLRKACEQLAAWSSQPDRRELMLAVNVSARQFLQPSFMDNVQRALALTGADPSLLTLEITETAILDDLFSVADKLSRLRAMGLRISLDDFGTGYSSLAYLSRLPLDELKIDQAFVARVPEDANDSMVVQTIIGMGCGLSLQVVAEGVENEAQHSFLMMQGCEIFQGYLIARPLPLHAFEQMLDERSARAASA